MAEELVIDGWDPNGSDEEDEEFTFDMSLAARHDYLGTDLEVTHGRTFHEESSIVWTPILFELEIVLVPGQTLPLTVMYPPAVKMLKEVIYTDKTFGVICLKGPLSAMRHSGIGTTAEIFEYFDGSEQGYLKLKAKGRQRFKLLETKQLSQNAVLGKVQILPELNMPKMLDEARLPSINRYRKNAKFKNKLSSADSICIPWPAVLLRRYDVDHIAELVIKLLIGLKFIASKESAPSDITYLSYYVVQCLPLSEDKKLHLLSRATAFERLQTSLRLLEQFNTIYCNSCENQLAERSNIFSMSVEGPSGTYCNSGGHVHEVTTVHLTTGIEIEQNTMPNTDYSWFPGYGWIIAFCNNCKNHIGWLFTAMNNDLHPYTFWGLTNRSISLAPMTPSTENDPHPIREFFETADFYR